jgi:tetratricopeptide (TPR) repeat protein
LIKKAIKDYDLALEINPNNAEIYINRGFAKYKLGLEEDAIKDYDYAIKIN